MKKSINAFILISLLISLVFAGCTESMMEISKTNAQPAKSIMIAGSGSNSAVTGELLKHFNQRYNQSIILLNSIGSNGGIKAVSKGAIQLGLTSRPMKDDEKGPGLKEIPYARIGIVFGVNKNVPDDEITTQDLIDIYSGRKNQWQNGQMIIVLSGDKGDSTHIALEKQVPGYGQTLADAFLNNRWQVIFSDEEEEDALLSIPSSFGFTDTAALTVRKLSIKPLKVDGVEPNINNVANGKYKFFKDLFFIYKDPLPGELQDFLDFVYSDEGQKIISQNGGIPL